MRLKWQKFDCVCVEFGQMFYKTSWMNLLCKWKEEGMKEKKRKEETKVKEKGREWGVKGQLCQIQGTRISCVMCCTRYLCVKYSDKKVCADQL